MLMRKLRLSFILYVCVCSGFALSTRRLTDTRNKFTKKVGLKLNRDSRNTNNN